MIVNAKIIIQKVPRIEVSKVKFQRETKQINYIWLWERRHRFGIKGTGMRLHLGSKAITIMSIFYFIL